MVQSRRGLLVVALVLDAVRIRNQSATATAMAQHTLSQWAQEHRVSNGAAYGVCVRADEAHDALCALHAVCDGIQSVCAAKWNTTKRS